MGTGVYTTTVNLDKQQAAKSWTIDLGDVRESARVYVNGTFAGCTWAAPFRLDLGNLLKRVKTPSPSRSPISRPTASPTLTAVASSGVR